jgi:uncharacterized membrane protein YphA (DoxX/SURF4 family)
VTVTPLAIALGTGTRATRPRWHLLLVRLVAAIPLLATGIMHVVLPDAPMRPLVEAAGLPLASLLAPVAVVIEIVAGASLLFGAWARLGALLAIPTMLVAAYAHLAIDAWPNPGGEPPLAVPLIVMICAAWVLRHGAGRVSVDGRARTARQSY